LARESGSSEAEAEAEIRESPLALERRKVADRDRRIAELEAKLARMDDGSLFDLKHDKGDDIGRAIADNVTETKFETIVAAAKARYKAKRSKPAAAGQKRA